MLHSLPQLDGNDSFLSSSSDVSSARSSASTFSLDQCDDQFCPLPKVYSANARSLFPKFKDFTEKLLNHRIDIAQISETWQDIKKGDHNDKIEILENRLGYKWYSVARPKFRDNGTRTGGGGSAILVNQRNFLSSKMNEVDVPSNLEVVWVKVFPKHKTDIKVFIVCGLYSKPSSRTKTLLNDHIASNYHLLKAKYDSVRFLFLGDFNDHKPDLILQLSSQLRQLVHYPTCGSNILDLLITDAHVLYHHPLPEAALLPDDPDEASPSDHLGNLLVPRTVSGIKNHRQHKLVSVRPMTQSKIDALGTWIVNEKWANVINEYSVDSKLEMFTNMVFKMLDEVAPTKKVKIACDDPAWMTTRIKTYIRRRNREFDKLGKSEKWKSLKNKCKQAGAELCQAQDKFS